ncbi:MazG nucleotide pyrophosphohydrolase domain-containing protein [Patescibacteria group bacterium]
MNKWQQKIKKFVAERDWDQYHNPKDLLLGIVEEVGEIRNIIKWEQDPEVLKKVLAENKDELEDNIGDLYWFLALLANGNNIDIDEAIDKVIKKNAKRFPLKEVKSNHTNIYLGGTDKDYEK